MLYDYIDALRMEIEYRKRQIAPKCERVGRPIQSLGERVLDKAAQTKPGTAIGKVALTASGLLGKVPILTINGDAIRSRYGIDVLAAQLRSEPRNPLLMVQLAEAIRSARRDQALLRWLRTLVEPTSRIMGDTLRVASRLGKQKSRLDETLLRRAYQTIVKRGGAKDFTDFFALARLYRLSGKPGLSTHYAEHATRVAFKEKDATVSVGQPKGGLLASIFASRPHSTDCQTNCRRKQGMAWTTLAWALIDSGSEQDAVRAANNAINLGFTGGYEVLAAAAPVTEDNLTAISERRRLLSRVSAADRRSYLGAHRGAIGATGSTLREQTRKTKNLVDSVRRSRHV